MVAKPKSRMATIRQPLLMPLRHERERREMVDFEEQLLAHGIPVPETEYFFARPIGREWRADYSWPHFKVMFEREGGTFGRVIVDAEGKKHRLVSSRHASPIGIREDCIKYNYAARAGWCVIRGTVDMIRDGTAIADLKAALLSKGWQERQQT